MSCRRIVLLYIRDLICEKSFVIHLRFESYYLYFQNFDQGKMYSEVVKGFVVRSRFLEHFINTEI